MRRRDFLGALGLAPLAGCARTRTAVARTHGHFEAGRTLAKLVPELMIEYNVPGAAVACIRNGKTVWSEGFGRIDSTSEEQVGDGTLFEAASVSKTVFAYAALKLCEKGVINLDIPLVRYTSKRFVEEDPRLDRITARHLLSHTSGFAAWRSSDGPLIRGEPGSAFQYSGEGYFYLQSVITEMLGKVYSEQCGQCEAGFEVCATDFDEFMKQRVLRPFGMRRSGYLREAGWERIMARGHNAMGAPIHKEAPRLSDVARYGAVGGLNTSAAEYAKFLIEVVAPRPADEFRLDQPMLREMVRPQASLPKGGEIDGCNAWALGWGVQERAEQNLLVHSGGQSGFRSLALGSMEKRSGLVILTNSDNGGQVIYHPEFLQLADTIVTG